MAVLIIEKGDRKDVGKTYPIDERGAVIGRNTPQAAPDIAINGDFVSRRHAEITFARGRYLITDLGSTNGTSVDQRRIEPGRPYVLSHDDVIGLGLASDTARVVLRFRETANDSTTPLPAESTGSRGPGWLSIDRERQEVKVDGKPVQLSRKEYDLIVYLQAAAGRTCGRDELISAVYPEAIDPTGVSNAALDQLVHRVRLKVEHDPAQPVRIVSRKGFGYMLVETGVE